MIEGIIYVLTNEAMPGYVKIGKTTTSVPQRMRELDNTSLPFPFECYYAARVPDVDRAERLVHDAFFNDRVSRRREFFTIDPERVRSAIRLAELEDVTPREEEVVPDSEDRAALDRAKERRRTATLGAVGIEPGTVLHFSKDPEITCVVADDRNVLFEDELTSLSGSALTILRRMGYEWNAANGWAFWTRGGRPLTELWAEVRDLA